MLAELFNAIVGVSQKAKSHEVKIADYPNDPDRRIIFTDDKRDVIDTPRQPPDPKSMLETVEDFARAFIERYTDEPKKAEGVSAVWFDNTYAAFFLDEPHRRQFVRIEFELSEVWGTVCKFEQPQIINQTAIVRLLRHDLMECAVQGELEAYRSIKFESYQGAARNLQNTSMDADLVVNSKTSDQKPDMLRLSVKPYLSDELREMCLLSLLMTVDIDTQKQLFTLQLAPNSVRGGILAMQETVRKALTNVLPEGTVILAGKA
jgi:hypothetical protein